MTSSSTPPTATVPTSPPTVTTPTPSSIAHSIASSFLSVTNLELIEVIVGGVFIGALVVMLIRALVAKKNRFLDINYRNADALFITIMPKSNKIVVVPTRSYATGMFIGTYRNEIYLYAVKPGIAPFTLINANKPVYFAIGNVTAYASVDIQSLSNVSILKTFSQDSLDEIIANILINNSKFDGQIPIANSYYLSIAIDVNKTAQDDLLEFVSSVNESALNMIMNTVREIRKMKELEIEYEKAKQFGKIGSYRTLVLVITVAMMLIIIMIYLFSHHSIGGI